jgi:23S rRNA pseudouridine2457 synthase
MSKIILFNKPFNVLCQFTDEGIQRETLADYIDIPKVYAAGRLDKDSEGLLLLTGDGPLQARISHPKFKLPKTYWVQVEGVPDEDAIEQLQKGVELKDGLTRPAEAKIIDEPKDLWERTPPVRYRANIPTTWLELTIREGKNRQVRRMTAAVGFPTLRLIRYAIGPWTLKDIASGKWIEMDVKPDDLPHLPVKTRKSRPSPQKRFHKVDSKPKKR